MPALDEFATVNPRLQISGEAAAAMVFRRYAESLVAQARSQVEARARQQADSEQYSQQVTHGKPPQTRQESIPLMLQ